MILLAWKLRTGKADNHMVIPRFSLPRRNGATLAESAIVYSVLFFLLLGVIVGGVGIYSYHRVALLAREGARWASVRGDSYEKETGNTAATPLEVFNNAIQPMASGLDPNRLSYNVNWSPNNKPGSKVIVRVNYQWVPQAVFGGGTLSSTAEMEMTY